MHYQVTLAQGDHGRDLYAAEAVWRGELPYKDFWWVYGPLMPYLYGFFYKILGTSLSSMLTGQMFFQVLSGIFIYLGLSCFIVPWGAALGALWFWSFFPDFFYTYNHTGGITLMMAAVCCLFYYLKKPKLRYLYLGLLALFVLCFVKINIGLFSLAAFLVLVAVINFFMKLSFPDAKRFYTLGAVAVPVVVLGIYLLLLKDLSLYEIRQCLPYLAEDHPYNAPPIVAIRNLIQMTLANISSSPTSILLALLVLLASAQVIFQFFNKDAEPAQKKRMALAILILIVFYVANFHEFLASGIVIYRSFWAKPFSIILIIYILYTAIQQLPRWINGALSATLVLILVLAHFNQYRSIQALRQMPWQNLGLPRANVFLRNQPEWLQTVRQAAQYLQNNLSPKETFLALPYDPLYYFLTGKQSPTRQLIFFEHINIPPQQEQDIIAELEKNNVNYILLSNRSLVPTDGLGIFGKTYCPLLGKYIEENFEAVQTFGSWRAPSGDGWAWDHSVRILKRIGQ